MGRPRDAVHSKRAGALLPPIVKAAGFDALRQGCGLAARVFWV
jgi:hypothetical protein